MKHKLIFLLLTLALSLSLSAQELRLPTVLSSDMVLQRNATVAIWGWAPVGATVIVAPSWSEESFSAVASEFGEWKVSLPTPSERTGEKIVVSCGAEKIVLGDIALGEVWICSGQSNMDFTIEKTIDCKGYLKHPNKNIRVFHVGRLSSKLPKTDIPEADGWQKSSASSLKDFSAVAYAFGDALQKELGVPVGLYQASYGGTAIETWMPAEVTASSARWTMGLNESIKAQIKKKNGAQTRFFAGTQYNAQIHPFINQTVAGVIWYQGCQNVPYSAEYYDDLQCKLIEVWRDLFRNPSMPFYLVQIAPHVYDYNNGALLREKQMVATERTEHTGYVCVGDVRDIYGDIHPRTKLKVGQRLAAWALGEHYGKNVEYRMPEIGSVEFAPGKAHVTFVNAPQGLICADDFARGFVLADGNGAYTLAKGYLAADGMSADVVAPFSETPTELRYCFDESVGNLVSASTGAPLAQYRTDVDDKIVSPLQIHESLATASLQRIDAEGLTKTTAEEGMLGWANRKYHLDGVPSQFNGLDALIPEWNGAVIGEVTFKAKTAGTITLLIRNRLLVEKLPGFALEEVGVINYRVPGNADGKLYVASRHVAKNEKITLPALENNPSGYIIIAKTIK